MAKKPTKAMKSMKPMLPMKPMKAMKPMKRGPSPERLVIAADKAGKVPDRLLDKRPMRAPRSPDAAPFESGSRKGAKKRLRR